MQGYKRLLGQFVVSYFETALAGWIQFMGQNSWLLAMQSGALSRGAFRDFQPNPNPSNSVPLIAFEHLSLHIQKHLSQSVAVCDSLWQIRVWKTKAEPGTDRYSQEQPGTVLKRLNMCYIFKRYQGYQIWGHKKCPHKKPVYTEAFKPVYGSLWQSVAN